jgi:hypothetical protein
MGLFKIAGLFYFNTSNNLEDLRLRISVEIEQYSPDIIERSVQNVYTRVKRLAGGNFNICLKFYC